MSKSHSNGGNRGGGSGNTQTHYRSAKTGQYVTERFAQHHPATTVKETDRKK